MICWYPEWLKTWSTYLFLGFFKTVDSQTHTELHGMRCDLAPHKEKLGTRETGKLWTIRKQSWLILWLLVDSAPCEELCQVSGGSSSLGAESSRSCWYTSGMPTKQRTGLWCQEEEGVNSHAWEREGAGSQLKSSNQKTRAVWRRELPWPESWTLSL